MMADGGRERSFDEQTVLITGGASGVGYECAKLFGENGAHVIIVGRNEKKLKSACDNLKRTGVRHVGSVAGDVAVPEFAAQAFMGARHITGRDVGVVVNNAGTILRKSAAETSDDDWRELMRVNLDGVFYFSRAAASIMTGEGAIVNVSSTCGHLGAAGLAAYCASKGGVDQLTRAMALELAPRKITVNAVAPGAINSPMLYSKHESDVDAGDVAKKNEQSIPIGALAEAVEVARAIKFLASERHITGAVLSIDGGYSAR